MKALMQFALVVSMSLCGAGFAADQAHDDKHGHEGLHGGVVAEVRDMDYELVVKPGVIQIYLRDHDKAVDVKGAKAKVTVFVGRDKVEAQLAPVADKLEAKGAFTVTAGSKAIAVVTLAGKSPQKVQFTLK